MLGNGPLRPSTPVHPDCHRANAAPGGSFVYGCMSSYKRLYGRDWFSTPDPALRDEQHRYVQICVNVAVEFAVIVDEAIELQDMCRKEYRLGRSKIPAVAKALLENQLHGWQDWRDAASPIAWVKGHAGSIHKVDHKRGGHIPEKDALYTTPERKQASPSVSRAFDHREATRGVIALEEISEVAGVAHRALEQRYTWMSGGCSESSHSRRRGSPHIHGASA
jgi:hypothetical protein